MRTRRSMAVLLTLLGLGLAAAPASAEQAGSKARSFQAGLIDAGFDHTCAVTTTNAVRCWGSSLTGQLGYGNTDNVGDDELPSSVGAVPVGAKATAVAAGSSHTCALLTTGDVRCWGRAFSGQLGYGSTEDVGDDEPASTAGNVPLGGTAKAIAAGSNHSCALLTTGAVRCWGDASFGRLGYGNTNDIGDDEPASAAGDVPLGGTAVAISAGGGISCALMTTGAVRCWGAGADGRLGYGNTNDIGDNELPSSAGDVPVGATVTAVSVGLNGVCVIVTGGGVRCWGGGGDGALGRGNTNDIGDDEAPAVFGNLPLGMTTTAIASGVGHVCALSTAGAVRCWGSAFDGMLGYGNLVDIGDDEPAGSVGFVSTGEPVTALATGINHTCALLISGDVRCWGRADEGQLGTATASNIGDDEPAASGGKVGLGAKVHGLVADLEVKVTAPAAVTTGTPFAATVTVTNIGPDAVSNLSLSVPKLAGVPSAGTHDPADGVWTVGGLSGGQSATLTLTDPAAASGARSFTAEVRSSSLHDPDSTPANGAAGEDDRATTTTTVSDPPPVVAPPVVTPPVVTPPASPPPVVQPPAATTRVRGKLSVTARLRPGSRTARISGKLVLPVGSPRTLCSGTVKVSLLRGTRAIATGTAKLKRPARGRTCTFATTVTLKKTARLARRQKLKVSARLVQTTRLARVTASATKTVPRR